MSRVSVIIAGRNEKYFQQTVDSVLESAVGDVEVVAVVDEEEYSGELATDDPYARHSLHSDDPRVRIIRLEKAIGQRAGYNLGVRESTGEHVMKIDAHALLSKGFDEELKNCCGDKDVVLPEMRRLNVREWAPKRGGEAIHMYFGLDMYCHYWRDRTKANTEKCPEIMTGQGSCWFCTREWNDRIGLLDEGVGSWGNVGIEISLRTWLQGGRQICCTTAWQAHYFRKDDGGFPYSLTGRDVARAHRYTRERYFFNDAAFEHQTRPFGWLVRKFQPPGWEAYLVDSFKSPRVIVYYTDSQLQPELANAVRKRIKKVCGPIPIISVSQEPLKFGRNVCIGEQPRKYKSVYEALLAGVKAAPEGSIVYLLEHDVFYHPSHFAFLPAEHGVLYFNDNRYYYHLGCDTFDLARGKCALSQCVAWRDDIIQHAEERLAVAGDDMTEYFETWQKRSSLKTQGFSSDRPNVDILHGQNLTLRGKMKNEYIRGKRKGIANLPGWGRAPHFRSVTGYRRQESKPAPAKKAVSVRTGEVDVAQVLQRKFRKLLPQVSPVRARKVGRSWLPELFRTCQFTKGAEIGVRKGEFSELICKANPTVEHMCVDLWRPYYIHNSQKRHDSHLAEAKRRLKPYRVQFVNMPSMEAARNVEDESLDYVYIDADHRFDFVMEDLIAWGRKVRPGGIVSGHDYYRFRNAGVVDAVDLYTRMHGVQEWFVTDEKESSFFWVKQYGC